MALSGKRRHRVRLENPTLTTDGDGGYTAVWSLLTPGVAWASVEPATAQRMERFGANAVTANASHVVEMPYHSGVTIQTRLIFNGRVLTVVGLQNPAERNIDLILACTEQLDSAIPVAVTSSWVQEDFIG